MLNLTHGISLVELYSLYSRIAKPTVIDGNKIVWIAPKWWHLLYDTVTIKGY